MTAQIRDIVHDAVRTTSTPVVSGCEAAIDRVEQILLQNVTDPIQQKNNCDLIRNILWVQFHSLKCADEITKIVYMELDRGNEYTL